MAFRQRRIREPHPALLGSLRLVHPALTKFEEHLKDLPAPFLFVGAGLSRRYAGADDWEGLLRHFAGQTSRPYDYFRVSAAGDLPRVASLIAEEFHRVWWNSARFESSRKTWSSKIAGEESALKVEIAAFLSDAVDKLPKRGPKAKELDLLSKAVVDGIITTNFDGILEHLFPSFQTFIGQNELLFSTSQGVGEIYKIHGSHTNPDSLVLTAYDYERFEQRNSYLAAKLLTIFVEHPVVFLGYSLSDPNVTSVLRSISQCLTKENIGQLSDRLLFVQWSEGAEPAFENQTILVDDFVIPVKHITVPDFEGVFTVLSGLQRTFPAKLLRQLKEQVYDLVLTGDPHHKLVVADIDDTTSSQDLEVVFGVGVHEQFGDQGYVALSRWDLIDDVISGGDKYRADRVMEKTLPSITGNAYVPVFKYLRAAGKLDAKGQIKKNAAVDPKVRTKADRNRGNVNIDAYNRRRANEAIKGGPTMADLTKAHPAMDVLVFAGQLPPDSVDTGALRQFLDRNRALRNQPWTDTQYAKLVCFYDWLMYGRG